MEGVVILNESCYGASHAISDHTVLPATRHKWIRPAAHPVPSQTGRHSIIRGFTFILITGSIILLPKTCAPYAE